MLATIKAMSLLGKIKANPIQTLLVALAVSLPFEYIPTIMLGGLRIRASVVIGVAVIAAASWGVLISRKLKPPKLISLVLLAWVIWLMFGAFQFIDWQKGLKVLIPLVFFGLLAISVSLLMRRQYVRSVFCGVLIGASVAALFGLYQYFGNVAGLPESFTGLRELYSWERFGFPRMQSVALEPLYFSNFLLLPIAICIVFFVRSAQRKLLILALFGFLIINILTLSRGGLAALVILLLTTLILLVRWKPKKYFLKRITIVATAGVCAIAVALIIIATTARKGIDPDVTYNKTGVSTFVSHIDNSSFTATAQNKQTDDSINQRNVARESAKKLLKDGVGVVFVGTAVGQYEPMYTQRYGVGPGAPNNIVLEQLIQTGAVGLLLLATIGFLITIGLWRAIGRFAHDYQLQSLAIALLAYWIAVAAQLQTFSGIGLTHIWFCIGISIFLIQSSQDIAVHGKKTLPKKNKI